jgi:hypothetical protein
MLLTFGSSSRFGMEGLADTELVFARRPREAELTEGVE